MDQQTFKIHLFYCEVMLDIENNRPDYWTGRIRGLRRAYHGEQFGTDAEHALWLSLSTSDDTSRSELGRGYRDGLAAEQTASPEPAYVTNEG